MRGWRTKLGKGEVRYTGKQQGTSWCFRGWFVGFLARKGCLLMICFFRFELIVAVSARKQYSNRLVHQTGLLKTRRRHCHNLETITASSWPCSPGQIRAKPALKFKINSLRSPETFGDSRPRFRKRSLAQIRTGYSVPQLC